MVVDVVHSGIEISGEKIFYGLYNVVVPKRCWASDNRFLLSTNQKNEIKTYTVDIGNSRLKFFGKAVFASILSLRF